MYFGNDEKKKIKIKDLAEWWPFFLVFVTMLFVNLFPAIEELGGVQLVDETERRGGSVPESDGAIFVSGQQ